MSGEPENEGFKAAEIVGAVVGFAAFIFFVARMVSAGSKTTADRNMMNAPGRPGQVIERGEFEKDTAGYFRGLRKK